MSEFTVRNENYVARTHASFKRQHFMETLGVRITDLDAGYCELQIPYDRRLTQQHGYFHGGVIGTLADNASGYAAFSLMNATDSVLTIEYKLNIMAPANGELLIARGQVLRPGRRVTVAQTELFSVKGGVETHCATSLVTLMVLANTPDEPTKET
ncbi:hypothetical protein A9Q96_16575 [Rhodobacterales bacterium 52_120_T64]|nr:hypothetical protein A9Q96_16575 [Rhodobacterales bacterium 52_120_T64]